MTVKQLIKELEKMPKNAQVATTAHDNSELEYQGYINIVELRDYDEVRKNLGHFCRGTDMGIKGKVVVLHH
jgi:hypothetical protein